MFSFDTRKRLCEVRNFVRQVVEVIAPCLPPESGEYRANDRSNRCLPVLLAPWEDGRPVVEESTYALTKDLSDRGMALVLHQPVKSVHVVVGLWLESPRFALAEVRQNTPLGGGFWQLGLELIEVIDLVESPQVESLVPLAGWLAPRVKPCVV